MAPKCLIYLTMLSYHLVFKVSKLWLSVGLDHALTGSATGSRPN